MQSSSVPPTRPRPADREGRGAHRAPRAAGISDGAPAAPWERAESEAAHLCATGAGVLVQDSAVVSDAARTFLAYALALLAAGLGAWRWPALGLMLLALLVASALVDVEGGYGWFRRFVPRRPGRNVIAWPDPAARDASAQGPALLVVLPLEGPMQMSRGGAAIVPLSGALFVAAAALVRRVEPAYGTSLMALGLGLLGTTAVVSLFIELWRAGSAPPPSIGPHLAESLLRSLRHRPTRHIRVAVALTTGGVIHHDGVEVLLRGQRHRFPQDSTLVLAVQPSPGPAALCTPEGRLRLRPAEPLVARAAEACGLEARPGVTAASRARRCGWRAAGIVGGAEHPREILHRLRDLIREIDRQTEAS